MPDAPVIPCDADFEAAFQRSVGFYLDECHGRARSFLVRHFGILGSLRRHRVVFGWDLLKAPLNLLWGIVLIAVKLLGWIAGRFGWAGLKSRVDGFCRRFPGLRTRLQEETERVFYQELLLLPYPGDREHTGPQQNRLAEILLEQPELAGFREAWEQRLRPGDGPLAEALDEFGKSQGSAADLFSNVTLSMATLIGTKSFSLGAIGAGGVVAKKIAIDSFWLGPVLGKLWYESFGRKVPTSLVATSILATAVAISVLAAFAGLVTDPFQTWTGIHRWRLNRILKALESILIRENSCGYTSKGPYLARLLDVADTILSATP
jgi:hypothetical protein